MGGVSSCGANPGTDQRFSMEAPPNFQLDWGQTPVCTRERPNLTLLLSLRPGIIDQKSVLCGRSAAERDSLDCVFRLMSITRFG
jgi:hypothetical protein